MPRTLPARPRRWAMWRPTSSVLRPTRSGRRGRQRPKTNTRRLAAWSANGNVLNSPTRSENLCSTTSGCATSCAGLCSTADTARSRRPPDRQYRVPDSGVCLFGRELRPVCLGPFLHLDELIRHQPMGLTMHCIGGFLVGRLDQTERPAGARIEPVLVVRHSVLFLNLHILLVSTLDRFCRQAIDFVMNVHVERHQESPFRVKPGLPWYPHQRGGYLSPPTSGPTSARTTSRPARVERLLPLPGSLVSPTARTPSSEPTGWRGVLERPLATAPH